MNEINPCVEAQQIREPIHQTLCHRLNGITGRLVITMPEVVSFSARRAEREDTNGRIYNKGKPMYLLNMEDIVRHEVVSKWGLSKDLRLDYRQDKTSIDPDSPESHPHYVLAMPAVINGESQWKFNIASLMPQGEVRTDKHILEHLPMQVLGFYEGLPVVYYRPKIHFRGEAAPKFDESPLLEKLAQHAYEVPTWRV